MEGTRPRRRHCLQHRDYGYVSIDSPVARDGARDDPMGFAAALPERVILDEIQRVPELFDAIKISMPSRLLWTAGACRDASF